MRKLILDISAFALISALCAATLMAKPERKDAPPPKKEVRLPDISGDSRWGFITQKGRAITITGHDQWEASGEIRADGKLLVTWIPTGTDRAGPGLYEIKANGSIEGSWNYADRVSTDKDGNLQGLTQPDTLRNR